MINKLEIEAAVRTMIDAVETEIFTPYAVGQVLQDVMENLPSEWDVKGPKHPMQMMYRYDADGRISGKKGQKKYSKDEVAKFLTKYLTKKIITALVAEL